MEISMAGKRVKLVEIVTGDFNGCWDFTHTPNTIATVANAYHGNYDIDWIVVEKDGKETMRIGINQNCIIQWWEA